MYIVYKLTGHIQRYGQGCVAMVKMNSKMQSCKEACNWLRSHTWDCEPANGIQAELGLLLRGVACNRVSWVFSISLTHTQSVSCSLTLSLLLLALPLPSLTPFPPPPRLPIALSQQFFFLHFYMCRRGRSTCWKFYWIFYAACCLLEPSKSYTWSSVCARVCVWQCSLESVKVCMCFSCLFFVYVFWVHASAWVVLWEIFLPFQHSVVYQVLISLLSCGCVMR